MTTREWWSRSRLELAASLSLVMALAVGRLVACDPKTEPTLGSETHFLMSCDASCPKDSSCYCGVCTRACADASECSELDKNAVCAMTAPRIAEGRCLSTVQSSVCEVNCLTDADCASLAGDFTCQAGVCRVDARASISDQSCIVGLAWRTGMSLQAAAVVDLRFWPGDLLKCVLAAAVAAAALRAFPDLLRDRR